MKFALRLLYDSSAYLPSRYSGSVEAGLTYSVIIRSLSSQPKTYCPNALLSCQNWLQYLCSARASRWLWKTRSFKLRRVFHDHRLALFTSRRSLRYSCPAELLLIIFIFCQHRPNMPRILIGERYRCHIKPSPCYKVF